MSKCISVSVPIQFAHMNNLCILIITLLSWCIMAYGRVDSWEWFWSYMHDIRMVDGYGKNGSSRNNINLCSWVQLSQGPGQWERRLGEYEIWLYEIGNSG